LIFKLFAVSFCQLFFCLTSALPSPALPGESQKSGGGPTEKNIQSSAADEKPPFVDGDALTEGLSEEALQKLVARAQETHSNALVVLKNGKLIGQWYFGHAVKEHSVRSITKAITALAIGKLIDEHKIVSLDQPISSFYPEWDGAKKSITLRHVLTQTSGLDQTADFSQPDVIKLALAADIKEEPGKKFVYNDRVSNLLAGVVQVAAGKPLDTYLAEKLFLPLGISNYHWDRDRSGQPLVMGGLNMNAVDLAKIGVMMASGGVWQGKPIISPAWIETLTLRSPANASYGLMWWLIEAPKVNAASSVLTRPIGYAARGYMGQALIILPRQKLVVVRLISEKSHKSESDNFDDLSACALSLLDQPRELEK